MAYPDALTGVMDLPQSIQSQVFSEILDDDVQKGILILEFCALREMLSQFLIFKLKYIILDKQSFPVLLES